MIASIGAAHVDRRGILRGPLVLGTSNPGGMHPDFGGVARNVAANLARLGCRVSMLSRVGDDEDGRRVIASLRAEGIDTGLVGVSAQRPTASYTAILETGGELVVGLADMDIYDEIDREVIDAALPRLRECGYWFIDANLPGATIGRLLEAGPRIVAVDAVSVAKSRRLRPLLARIPVLFANIAQAAAIAERDTIGDSGTAAAALRSLGARAGVVTAAARPITVWGGDNIQQFPVVAAAPRDVTGAGDAMIAGTLFGLIQGLALHDAAGLGLAAAAITVEAETATAPAITPAMLKQRAAR
jgi:pseudouridine kinase